MAKNTLIWFRRDLRTRDHAALSSALQSGDAVNALYVPEAPAYGQRMPGGASRWWLHHSLAALGDSLKSLNIDLTLRQGDPSAAVVALAEEAGAARVVCSRVYEPAERQVEESVAAALARTGRTLEVFEGSLLQPPGAVLNKEGDPYRVFTPYWKAWRTAVPPSPLPRPKPAAAQAKTPAGERLEDLRLLPTAPDWAAGLRATWQPGEAGAQAELRRFIDTVLGDYEHARNIPGRAGTSRLSAHLHFGEISPSQIWHSVHAAAELQGSGKAVDDAWAFIRELCWRDFNHDLLARYPDIAERNIDTRFDQFPWEENPEALAAWQQGRTGYPIVDAGMRELWTTGWMHNRVRMIVASFLIKHLLIHWRHGEAWFWDTLVDADLANNAANWQWVAGSGVDAAPYFRIFNPILQGERFDPKGDYVRKWLPERGDVPIRDIHKPNVVAATLFEDAYPDAIVEHKAARRRALDAFGQIKAEAASA